MKKNTHLAAGSEIETRARFANAVRVYSFHIEFIVGVAGESLEHVRAMHPGNCLVIRVIGSQHSVVQVVIHHRVSECLWRRPMQNCKVDIDVGHVHVARRTG